MKRDLEYFDDLLNNPASLSNPEFHRLFHEWVEFLRANPKKFGMKGRGWKRAHRRIGSDLQRRDRIKEEFDELDELMEASENIDDAEQLKLNARWLDFMKNYHLEYEFTEEMIAEAEAKLAAYAESVRRERQAQINLQIANGKVEASKNALADAMFEAQDKNGKPFALPAYKTPKRSN